MTGHADTIRRADELSATISMRLPTLDELEQIRETLLDIPGLVAELRQAQEERDALTRTLDRLLPANGCATVEEAVRAFGEQP